MSLSSNQNMEFILEQLGEIKQIEPNAQLALKIHQKIQEKENRLKRRYQIAVCIFLLFISSEFFMAYKNFQSKQNNHSELTAIIYKTHNVLYHE